MSGPESAGQTSTSVAPAWGYHMARVVRQGERSIKIVVNANEQCAAFSAAGYSRSTDKVGVAIVTSVPAITNTLTAVADSYADGIPLLIIAGQVPEHKIGTDSFQHIDVASVFGPTAKHVVSVTSIGNIEDVIKDAYFRSRSMRRSRTST